MNAHQATAIGNPCYFAFETAQPRFHFVVFGIGYRASVIITVNSGYE